MAKTIYVTPTKVKAKPKAVKPAPVTLPKVTDIRPIFGCDPEFFFKFKGEIIGAEKLLAKDGLNVTGQREMATGIAGTKSKFIIDGVQAELNPRPFACRANLANEIAACFKTLKAELDTKGNEFMVDFSRTVEISKENLMQLDEASRKFGCAPSKSIYRKPAGVKIAEVDPTEYRVRAAGGHIHISAPFTDSPIVTALTTDHKRTVAMLDLLCGNTAVLIDRDPGNIERRKVYGKAGEFRLPKHGLEYRTLSNFWLTAYPLMSLAFGTARLAVQLMSSTNKEEYFKEFTSRVKPKDIHTAINNNDFDLAMNNFSKIEKLILDVSSSYDAYVLNSSNIKEFHHFVKMIQTDGLGYWFKQDPLTHWTTIGECHAGGFSDYLLTKVREDMNNKKVAVAA